MRSNICIYCRELIIRFAGWPRATTFLLQIQFDMNINYMMSKWDIVKYHS